MKPIMNSAIAGHYVNAAGTLKHERNRNITLHLDLKAERKEPNGSSKVRPLCHLLMKRPMLPK
jgi:hypothetical protein